MKRIVIAIVLALLGGPMRAQSLESLVGKKTVFLGDSITQDGRYVAYTAYYLDKFFPQKNFAIYGLGLASETVSGLSEANHAGGAFPRPCLFERLGRLLDKVKPDVVFACYGINDGIYQPFDPRRFAAFKKGINRLIKDCQAAGVKEILLITPPIHDFTPKPGQFNYDAVMEKYAAWERTLRLPGVSVIDLHTAMRKARAARTEAFSRDHVHPGDEGHLLMAKTVLAALGVRMPDDKPAAIKAEPLFKLVAQQQRLRSAQWMKHIGYTREKTVRPQPLGSAEADAAAIQKKIDALRRR